MVVSTAICKVDGDFSHCFILIHSLSWLPSKSNFLLFRVKVHGEAEIAEAKHIFWSVEDIWFEEVSVVNDGV